MAAHQGSPSEHLNNAHEVKRHLVRLVQRKRELQERMKELESTAEVNEAEEDLRLLNAAIESVKERDARFVFKLFVMDDDEDALSRDAFAASVSTLSGEQLGAEDIASAFEAIDRNGTGRIELDDFVAWWTSRSLSAATKTKIRKHLETSRRSPRHGPARAAAAAGARCDVPDDGATTSDGYDNGPSALRRRPRSLYTVPERAASSDQALGGSAATPGRLAAALSDIDRLARQIETYGNADDLAALKHVLQRAVAAAHAARPHSTNGSDVSWDSTDADDRLLVRSASVSMTPAMALAIRQYDPSAGAAPLSSSGTALGLYSPPPDGLSLEYFVPMFRGLHSTEFLRGAVEAVHLEVLMRLVLDSARLGDLREVFLITHRRYLSTAKVVTLLQERYDARPWPGLEGSMDAATREDVRVVVLEFIAEWATDFYQDLADADGGAPLAALTAFVKRVGAEVAPSGGPLVAAAVRAVEALAACGLRASAISAKSLRAQTPLPLFRRGGVIKTVAMLSAVEVARQLTLIHSAAYLAIQPHEFLKSQSRPNLDALTNLFNTTSAWAATELLRQPEFRDRVRVLARLIDIAHACGVMGNYNAQFAIGTALASSTVSRLEGTFAALPDSWRARLSELTRMISPPQVEYQSLLKHIAPPAVPYTGPFENKLDAVETNMASFDEALLDWTKFTAVAHEIRAVLRWQRGGAYAIQPVPAVQEYLQSAQRFTDAEQLRASYELVPRRGGAATQGGAAGGAAAVPTADTPPAEPIALEEEPALAALTKPCYVHNASAAQAQWFEAPLPCPARPTSVFDVPSMELARQFSLPQFQAFAALPADALLRAVEVESSPAIDALGEQLSTLREWVRSTVLRPPPAGMDAERSLEHRARIVCKLVDVCHCFLQLNNFAALESAVIALSRTGSPCGRLVHTLNVLPDDIKRKLSSFRELSSSTNPAFYIRALRNATAPGIPILRVHIRAIQMVRADVPDYQGHPLVQKHLNWVRSFAEYSYRFGEYAPVMAVAFAPAMSKEAQVRASLAFEPEGWAPRVKPAIVQKRIKHVSDVPPDPTVDPNASNRSASMFGYGPLV